MSRIHFALDKRKRTVLEGIVRALIMVMTILLLLPCLLIGILFTLIFLPIPLKVHRLILTPFDLAWRGLLWALLKSSETWEERPLFRLPLVIIGIPLAVISYAFVGCMPALPYDEMKESRLALCDQWPLTWSLWRQLDSKPYVREDIRSFLPEIVLPRRR